MVGPAGSLDASYWVQPPIDVRTITGVPGPRVEMFQQLTPLTTGRIDRVGFHVSWSTTVPDTVPGDVQISIQTLDEEWGIVTGTVLGHGVLSAEGLAAGQYHEVEVELDLMAPVQEDVRYGMVMSMAPEDPDVGGAWAFTTPGGGYSDGALGVRIDGGMWNPDGFDLSFRTWVLPDLP